MPGTALSMAIDQEEAPAELAKLASHIEGCELALDRAITMAYETVEVAKETGRLAAELLDLLDGQQIVLVPVAA